jgi:hypothetical protein
MTDIEDFDMSLRKLETQFEANPSSLLKAARYDRISNALSVDFKTKVGMSYTYFEVPEDIARQLFEAKSPGTFFQNKVKGKYTFVTKTQRLPEKTTVEIDDKTSNLQTATKESSHDDK